MTDKKVCVYGICKDEMKYLDAWLESMSEADYIVVLDTGSTDGSFEYLQNDTRCYKVEQKVINPWRFDVARNESLKLIPDDADIFVCTDPDELFEPGWCKTLKSGWVDKCTRATYTYAWRHSSSGEPMDVFTYDKIHTKGYYWRYPIHEVLWRDDMENEIRISYGEHIYLHHWQDLSRDRKSYLDLLKIAVEENPTDAHVYHLYAREHYLQGMFEDSKKLFYNLLRLPDAYTEQNKEVLLDSLLSHAALSIDLNYSSEDIIYWIDQFLRVDDTYREPYLLYCDILIKLGQFELAQAVLDKMNDICYRHYSWVEKAANWLYTDKVLQALIYLNTNRMEEGNNLLDECLKYDPENSYILSIKEQLESKKE